MIRHCRAALFQKREAILLRAFGRKVVRVFFWHTLGRRRAAPSQRKACIVRSCSRPASAFRVVGSAVGDRLLAWPFLYAGAFGPQRGLRYWRQLWQPHWSLVVDHLCGGGGGRPFVLDGARRRRSSDRQTGPSGGKLQTCVCASVSLRASAGFARASVRASRRQRRIICCRRFGSGRLFARRRRRRRAFDAPNCERAAAPV